MIISADICETEVGDSVSDKIKVPKKKKKLLRMCDNSNQAANKHSSIIFFCICNNLNVYFGVNVCMDLSVLFMNNNDKIDKVNQVVTSPGWYLNVGDGVEVLEQIVTLDVGAPEGGPEKPQPKVGEGEEVPQSFHALHAGVQVVHVL